jgi:sensor histidine kinase regulating citrate/malate metabolism
MKWVLFLNYCAAMAIATMLTGLIYVTVQQNYRTGANDPQIQVAKDIKAKLQRGMALDVLWPDSIEIQSSLGLFILLYDAHGQPLRGSALLDGKFPQMPAGVFDFVKNQGEERVTWQPRAAVRMAMVVLRGNFSPVGYIAVGRSLAEVEIREKDLRYTTLVCWLLMMATLIVIGAIHYRILKRQKPANTR